MNLCVPVAFPHSMWNFHCFCVSAWSGTWLYAYFRSIFEKYGVPAFCLSSLILHAIVSMRWSMLCIWYLILWIASFSLFESSAILIDFTVITTGRMKYSSENLCNFIIFLSSMSLCSSLSALSISWSGALLPLCCIGWNVWWNVDFAMWFFDLVPILVQRCGYFWNTHFAKLFCIECIFCIFSPGSV